MLFLFLHKKINVKRHINLYVKNIYLYLLDISITQSSRSQKYLVLKIENLSTDESSSRYFFYKESQRIGSGTSEEIVRDRFVRLGDTYVYNFLFFYIRLKKIIFFQNIHTLAPRIDFRVSSACCSAEEPAAAVFAAEGSST